MWKRQRLCPNSHKFLHSVETKFYYKSAYKKEEEQVFSPGVSVNLGMKNTPLTWGLGAQYTPELRRITHQGQVITKANAWRFFLRLSWDFPLLNVAVTPFKK